MADIVIKGMEMPTTEGSFIDIRLFKDGRAVTACGTMPYYEEHPVIILPEGHGRLIDAGALIEIISLEQIPAADVIQVEWILKQDGGDELVKRWNEYKEECK